jgi:hypothetical protein
MSIPLPQVSSPRLQYALPITTTPSSWSDILKENSKWDHGVFVISFLLRNQHGIRVRSSGCYELAVMFFIC